DGDPALQLNAAPDEEGVVRDLLHDGVLEAVPALAPLARGGLEYEVRRDELVDRIGDPRAAGLAENAVAEALSDHRRELDGLPRRRRQPVDASRDDTMKRRRHLERRRPLAQLPFALVVLRDRARIHERADGLLDEERVAAGTRDDLVSQLVRHPVERRVDDACGLLVRERLEDELAEVRAP